jgi:hypothetical protein
MIRETLMLFGGRGFGTSTGEVNTIGLLNDLWSFDPDRGLIPIDLWKNESGSSVINQKGSWGDPGLSNLKNVPSGRDQSCSWNKDNTLYLFGGFGVDGVGRHGTGGVAPYGTFNDLWSITIAVIPGREDSFAWTWLSGANVSDKNGVYGPRSVPLPSNVPGGRDQAISWTDPATDRLFLFGGRGFSSGGDRTRFMNDLWSFDLELNEWVWWSGSNITQNNEGEYGNRSVPAAANIPGSRYESVSWAAVVLGVTRLYVFGGTGYGAVGGYGELNDLWYWDTMLLQWCWASGR